MKALAKKIINHYELNHKYIFDITDLFVVGYVICVIGIIMGKNMTPLFFLTCLASTIANIKTKRLNLLIMNIAFLIMNLYYLILMFI